MLDLKIWGIIVWQLLWFFSLLVLWLCLLLLLLWFIRLWVKSLHTIYLLNLLYLWRTFYQIRLLGTALNRLSWSTRAYIIIWSSLFPFCNGVVIRQLSLFIIILRLEIRVVITAEDILGYLIILSIIIDIAHDYLFLLNLL